MYRLLEAKNRGLRRDMMRFARNLVATPSPSGQEERVAALVEGEMRRLGYDKVIRDAAGNVIGILFGRSDERVALLASHMDVASVWGEKEWSFAPFAADLVEGRLRGRGASDAKGGLAAQVYAGALLRRSLLPMRGHLIVVATVGEEEGDSPGVRMLLRDTLPALGLRPDAAVLGEPTDLHLYYGHDGWAELDVQVEGPDRFQVDDAARAVDEALRDAAASDCLGWEGPFFEEVRGARRARIRVARRLAPSCDLESLLRSTQHRAEEAAKAVGAVAVAVAVRQETRRLYTGATTVARRIVNAWETDPFTAPIERARHALEAAGLSPAPGKWRLGRMGMGTAGSVFLRDFGVPVLGFGPGSEDTAHAPDEWVDAEKVYRAAYGTAAIVHSLIGIPVYGWSSDEI